MMEKNRDVDEEQVTVDCKLEQTMTDVGLPQKHEGLYLYQHLLHKPLDELILLPYAYEASYQSTVEPFNCKARFSHNLMKL